MASQQPPSRPWFRLGSLIRPAAQPQPPQPIRPSFPRPTRPTQPQSSDPTPPPPLAVAPPSTTILPPPPAVTAPIQSSPLTKTSYSLPPSPKLKFSSPPSSLPNRPAAAGSVSTSSSTPQSPQTKTILAPSSSLPNSPAVARPVSTSASATPSPQTKVFSAPSSSLPTSPAPKVLLAPSFPNSIVSKPVSSPLVAAQPQPPAAHRTTVTAPAVKPTSPPKSTNPSAKTPIQSPKNNIVSSPPSPLILPPALMRSYPERQPKNVLEDTEEKTVVVKEVTLKPKLTPTTSNANYSPNWKQVSEKDMEKKEQSIFKKLHDSNGFGRSIITIAGQNKGAAMELGSRKKHANPIAGSNGKKSGKDSSSDEEEKSKMNGKTHKAKAKAWPRMTAFMNSNVQCVNNSILCNSSCTHHDPGVHLSLPAEPNSDKQS